ncbi:MAG: dipeptidase [Sphingomicrobium sp.]
MKLSLFAALLLAAAPALAAPAPIDPATAARIDRILRATPLIDGHNDLPEQLREYHKSSIAGLASGTDRWPDHPLMTDIARLHAGRVGAQFWSVYIDASVHGDEAIRQTIEQIDIVTRLVAGYPRDLEIATTADDIVRIHRAGKIASLIGIEGGHQIGGSLAALRQFYRLGARYMTLAHFKNSEVADSATDDPKYDGLSPFGRTVVREMNRVGMLIDLAHVSPKVMSDVLDMSRAPVVFTHSDSRALNDHPRNVPNDILRRVSANGGVVMVNFYPGHLSPLYRARDAEHDAEEAREKNLFSGQPERRASAMKAWVAAHPVPSTPIAIVADHIDYVAKLAGHDHVGIGGDLDGGLESTVDGLGGVDGYPLLFAELIRRGWSDANLAALAGGNALRALRGAEATALAMRGVAPAMDRLSVAP